MRIQIAHSPADIDRLRPAWEQLHGAAPGATIFQSYAWNRLAAEHFAGREQPYVVLAESDSGAALIPAAINHHGITLLGETLFDYRDLLAAGDAASLRAAWAELARLRLPMTVTALRGEEARARWQALAPAAFVKAPQVRLDEMDAEAFEGAHRRLGRTLRLLARDGVELRRYDGSATDVIASIYRRKAEQPAGNGPNLFTDPARVDFMLAACALDPCTCDVFTFEHDQQLVAGLVTFRDRSVRRFYTVVFDPHWARRSPGTALCFEVTRQSLADGLDCDYMTGEQSLKARFMTSATPLFRVHAPAAALARAARFEAPAVAA